MRSPFRFILPALALVASLASATESRAEPPDSRFGLLPLVGAGMAGLTAHGALPAFIGYTTMGAELFGQLKTWGLFLRFDFLTSGNLGPSSSSVGGSPSYSAGYQAYGFDAGASYRVFGDSRTVALFARAGLAYEHWNGQEKTPCAIDLFVPTSCVTQGGLSAGYAGDTLGATLGARMELPLKSFYVAVGANFVPMVTVHTTNETATPVTAQQPGDIFQLRLDLALGLRDARGEHAAQHDYNEHRMSY